MASVGIGRTFGFSGHPPLFSSLNFQKRMGFKCPWGCAEKTEHESAWECPKYSQKFLGALQAVGQKMEKTVS